MSATLGRAGIRHRSAWRIAAVVAALTPPAVSMMASVTPLAGHLSAAAVRYRLRYRPARPAARHRVAAALPIRECALRVGLDQANVVAGLDGRAARGRWRACSCRCRPFGWPIRSYALRILWMFLGGLRLRHANVHRFSMPSYSRSGRAQPDPKVLRDRGCPNHECHAGISWNCDYSGRMLASIRGSCPYAGFGALVKPTTRCARISASSRKRGARDEEKSLLPHADHAHHGRLRIRRSA